MLQGATLTLELAKISHGLPDLPPPRRPSTSQIADRPRKCWSSRNSAAMLEIVPQDQWQTVWLRSCPAQRGLGFAEIVQRSCAVSCGGRIMGIIRRIYVGLAADPWLPPNLNDLKWGIVGRSRNSAIRPRYLPTRRACPVWLRRRRGIRVTPKRSAGAVWGGDSGDAALALPGRQRRGGVAAHRVQSL